MYPEIAFNFYPLLLHSVPYLSTGLRLGGVNLVGQGGDRTWLLEGGIKSELGGGDGGGIAQNFCKIF